MIGFHPAQSSRRALYDDKGSKVGYLDGDKLTSVDGRLIAMNVRIKKADASSCAVSGQVVHPKYYYSPWG